MIEFTVTIYQDETGHIHTKCVGDNVGTVDECEYASKVIEGLWKVVNEVGQELGYADAAPGTFWMKRTKET